MKKLFLLPLMLAFMVASPQLTHAQLLKKLKQKVSDAANKAIGGDNATQDQTTNSGSDQGNVSTDPVTGKPTNKGGAGLKNTTPPDVNQQLNEAEQAHDAAKYSDARYALQQALMGIEIQLGRELLKSLPDPVGGLPKDTTQDKVVSTQWGWNNMTIQRIYTDHKDKQLTVTIGNNAFYSGLVNVYFNSAYSVQANGDQQNMKQVKVKGNKAVIQYDDSKGYSLIIPIGQSSMIVWEAINFANEDEVMNAANAFDIDGIKEQLGEQ
ncbi:MAG: hypothetical protein ACTHJ5_03365 [Ilyomonas sp.]